MKSWLTILRNRKLWAVAAALVAGYLLTGFLLLPWLAERYVSRIASEQLQRPVTLGKVRFNPILFKLELNDVALTEPQGEPMASLGRLFVDFELTGLFRRAFAFRAIELEKLRLHPQIGPDGRLNFARLADAFPPAEEPEPPPDEKSELPRLLIDHFALIDGAVEFSDLSKEPGVSERLESINFKLDAISTLPDNEASHHFTAAFEDGSALDWHGQVSFNPIASEGELKLEGFKLATPWPFVKDRFALEPPEGQLTAGASYRFRKDGDTIDLALTEIAAAITGLKALPLGGKEPLLAFEQIQLGHGTFSLADQAVKIPEFTLRKGALKAAIDERGALNWQQLVKPAASASPAPASQATGSPPVPDPESTPAKPWHVDIEAFRLEELALQLTDASRQMPLDANIGAFGLGFKLAAEAGAGDPKVTIGGLSSEIRNVGLKAMGAKDSALVLETFRISDGAIDLAARTVSLPTIAIQKGSIRTEVDARGAMNWQQFATPANAVPAPPSIPPGPKPAAKAKATKAGKISKSSKSSKAPRTPKAAKPGKPDASAAAAAPATAQSPWRVNVDALKIEQIGVHYADDSRRTPLAVDVGSFGLGLRAAIEAGAGAPKVLIDALQSEIKQIALRERQREKPLASLESIAVGGGKLDLAQNTIGIQQITLTGGATAIERDDKGAIRLAEVFSPRDEGKVIKTVHQVDVTAKQEGRPWQLAVGLVNLNGFQATFQDRSVTPPFMVAVRPADFHLKNVTNFGKAPVAFDGKIHVVQGGDFSVTGNALTNGERGQAELRVDRLSLAGLQPYVAQIGALKLESGNLSTHLKVAFEQKAGKLSLTAKGEAGSADLLLKEAKSGKRFASWEKLDVNGIDFSLAPDKLAIREINVTKPGANIEIFEDRSSNVAAIFAPQPGASPKPGTPPARGAPAKPAPKSAAGAKAATGKPFPFSVQRVKIDQAIFDFSDLSLILPFKTRIQNFGGTISGISNAPASRTLLKLDGRVDEYGEANLEGTLDLMQHKAFSDVTLIFRNVEMSSLSPYSGTFAGRQIQSGKLNAELQYKIENSHMKSNGKIELDQVALGAEVVSPKAKSLPLDMALALLKDSAGKISVSVPIEGNVDDPQFAYGPVIWNAIATLITKVVTAPFTALAGVFGNGDEDMGEIFFIPGKNGLPPAEIEKLRKLATGLGSRPNLMIKVTGTFDPTLDAEALKSWSIRTAVTERLGIQVAPGEDPGPVAFDSAKSQKALEDLADDARGAGALAAAQSAFREQFGREPKRIGGLSSWMDKASEDARFYQLLFERLVQSAPLPPNALEALGDRRAQAIAKELAAHKGVDRSRVRLDKPSSTGDKDGRIPAKLDLATSG